MKPPDVIQAAPPGFTVRGWKPYSKNGWHREAVRP